jgi:hypothetical protein
MKAFPINDKITDWLQSLPRVVPLRAKMSGSTSQEGAGLARLIAESEVPVDSLVVGLLWLRVGIIEPAHEIVQDDSTQIGSYLHGVVHRLEGDYWNAKYWFRHAKEKRWMQLLSNAVVQRVEQEGLLDMATELKVIHQGAFLPTEFVSAHEQLSSHSRSSKEREDAVGRIAFLEWECLCELIGES